MLSLMSLILLDFKLSLCSECYILFLGAFPVSEFYVPTFQNTHNAPTVSSRLFFLLTQPVKMEQCVLKRRHLQFRHWGITQKKEYNITDSICLQSDIL
jgi:hypothetical protein